jgi:hypothetical protein
LISHLKGKFADFKIQAIDALLSTKAFASAVEVPVKILALAAILRSVRRADPRPADKSVYQKANFSRSLLASNLFCA